MNKGKYPVQCWVELEIKERKEKTGLSWAKLIELGITTKEEAKDV